MNMDAIRILLVEDNKGDARLLHEVLSGVGSVRFDLTHVGCLEEAEEFLSGRQVDVVLLDLTLPDGTGLETVRKMHGYAPDVPIMVLTGVDDEALAIEAVRVGAQDYLVKGQMDGNLIVRSMRYAIERKKTEEKISRSLNFCLTLFDAFPSLIWRSDIKARCDYFNRAWLDFTGRGLEQEKGDGWREGIHPDDFDQFNKLFEAAFSARKPFEIEHRLRRYDGEYRWVLDCGRPFNDLDGNFAGFIGSCYDITERRRQEDQLAYLATHDPLTSLMNRRSIEDTLGRAVARARRGAISALMLVDVDNFKTVNDTLGHAVGDQVLIALAHLLLRQLRASDIVARLGGDEFAILLEGAHAEEALVVAERIRQAVYETPIQVNARQIHITLSIGLMVVDGEDEPGLALSKADAAMYKAKERGRNGVALYQPDEDPLRFTETDYWASRLKNALKEDRLVLRFMPVVSFKDGDVDHHEVMVFLHSETGEEVTPAMLFPLAERAGLMPQFSRWMVDQVTTILHQRHDAYCTIDLPGSCLTDEDLLGFIAERLACLKIEPARLGFEITEAALGRDLVLAERWCLRLRELGCRIVLDDIGSGFNCLFYLRNLAADMVKLNAMVVRNIRNDSTQLALAQAVLAVSRGHEMRVVAKAVTDEDERRILEGIGINLGQGTLFGPPAQTPTREQHWRPAGKTTTGE